ncbi:protein arginine N-methyltransferase 6 [Cephus cinctus]|uniref:type I protein arginine methyltransferase n=1 Tax=Cephus cinctus TaxID=211228 RepID=A0AAJ7RTW7_CEPCN|nr:protein arginine N-methyltransferase 6 [Cephus cinctus]
MQEGDSVDEYFRSYEELNVHHLMLDDNPRTFAYRKAIFEWREKFKNKVVMDVGAGTGILSIFCAQAGAKKVYAVEASKLAILAKEVVIENNFENVVQVIHNKVEDLDANVIEKVDILVSEWMGFYLVHEGMLNSVIVARDRYLKPEGFMFPSIAKLYAAPCQLPSFFDFWNNVYGVSMKCVGKKYRETKPLKPEVLTVKPQDLLSEGKLIAWLDLKEVSDEDLSHLGGNEWVFPCTKDGNYQGACIWFVVEFPNGSELPTSPMDEETHWKQTVIVLPSTIDVKKGEAIAFKMFLHHDLVNSRRYNIEFIMLDPADAEHDIPCSCNMPKCIVTRAYIQEHVNNPPISRV